MVAEEVPPGPSGEHIAQEITEADLLAADRDFDAGIQALKVWTFWHVTCQHPS